MRQIVNVAKRRTVNMRRYFTETFTLHPRQNRFSNLEERIEIRNDRQTFHSPEVSPRQIRAHDQTNSFA
jgi:hypothetical protein